MQLMCRPGSLLKMSTLEQVLPLPLRYCIAKDKETFNVVFIVLKELYYSTKSSSKQKQQSMRAYCNDVQEGQLDCLSNIVQKAQERSSLKYPLVRSTSCLIPNQMNSNPDMCQKYINVLTYNKFLENKQLPGGISAGI